MCIYDIGQFDLIKTMNKNLFHEKVFQERVQNY